MNKVEQLMSDLEGRLGLSRFLARRAIAELRDHLLDSVADQLSRGVDEPNAQEHAIRQIGIPGELVRTVIDMSGGLKMIHFLKKRLMVTAAVLAAPGAILLALSFLTFNFTCQEITYEYMGEVITSELCGVRALEGLRPLISDVGFYGGPAWIQWAIHVVAVVGPLFASLLLVRSMLSLRRTETTGGVAEIAFALDRKHLLALAGSLSIFVTVVAYKAAG